MNKQRQPCPHCGQPIEAVDWKSTMLRFNISKGGIIGAAPFDMLVSVPPGEFRAQPCGHWLDPDTAQKIMTDYAGPIRRTAKARQSESQE